MFKFIPDENLKALDDYKYNGGEYTSLDNFCNIFWNWAIRLMPTSIHPNMITLMGSSFLVISMSLFFMGGSNPLFDQSPGIFYFIQ